VKGGHASIYATSGYGSACIRQPFFTAILVTLQQRQRVIAGCRSGGPFAAIGHRSGASLSLLHLLGGRV
jgi:hypothetical protein